MASFPFQPRASDRPDGGRDAPPASPIHGLVPPSPPALGQTPTSPGLGASTSISEGSLPISASVGLVASSADRSPHAAAHPRESFLAEELAIVLSHFDIGPIESIQEFRRGSRRSPKLIIKSSKGLFLLKRRAPGRDDPARVEFSHALQSHLAAHQFPVPRLIETRDGDTTMLRLSGRIYELFEFLPGVKYDGSLAATMEAGHTLALFHKIVANGPPSMPPAHAHSYHALSHIPDSLEQIARAAGPGQEGLRDNCRHLRDLYLDAGKKAEKAGVGQWPRQIVHGDWHPGNTLFRGSRVVAVIDFDAVRPEPRALDVSNGALQFSITMNGQDLASWPDYLDDSRFKRFCRGYDSVEGCILSTAELQALPWLMIEALVVEAVIPIAATGAFAGLDGAAFLAMIRRKADWLAREAPRLTELVSA